MLRRIAYCLIWLGLLVPCFLILRSFVRLVMLQAEDTNAARMEQAASDAAASGLFYVLTFGPIFLLGVGLLIYCRATAKRSAPKT